MASSDWNFDQLTDHFAQTLIYFVGNARGGSTFGNAAVGIHPSLLEVRWNNRIFAEVWPRRETASDEEWRKLLLRGPRYYDEARARQILGPSGFERLHCHIEKLCRTRNLRDVLCFPGILFWLMRDTKPDLSELRGWCFKANSWRGIDLVAQTFPDVRFLFIQRDPRATALSMAKVIVRRKGSAFGDSELLKSAMDWLRNATEFATCLRRHPGRSLAFRYEDLVQNPVQTLNAIYAFLKLPTMEPEAILHLTKEMNYSQTQTVRKREKLKGIHVTKERNYPQTQTVRTGEKLKGIHVDGLQRWQRELSSDQLALLVGVTAAAAQRFNYDLGVEIGWRRAGRPLLSLPPRELIRYAYCHLKLSRCSHISLVRFDS